MKRRLRNFRLVKQLPRRTAALLIPAACLVLAGAPASAFETRGGQFVGFSRFSSFKQSDGARSGETVLESPVIAAGIHWDQLVASWNAETPDAAYLKVEARALYPGRATKYYTMGLWAADPTRFPRECVPGQKDADGDVSTDTLILKRACDRLQIRLTLGGDDLQKPKLKYLGLCLTDTRAAPPALPANRAAWARPSLCRSARRWLTPTAKCFAARLPSR